MPAPRRDTEKRRVIHVGESLSLEDKEQLRAVVETRIDECIASLGVTNAAINELGGDNGRTAYKTGSLGDHNPSKTEEALNRKYREELGLLRRVLSRIDEGDPTLGFCQHEIHEGEICDEPIGLKRLLVMPCTTMCTVCKEGLEKTHGKHRLQ